MKSQIPLSRLAKLILCAVNITCAVSANAEPFAYITNTNEHTVSVIDTKTDAVVDLISGGLNAPAGVGVHPSGNFVYVVNNGGNPGHVSVIDTTVNTIVAEITVGNSPIGLAAHPNGETLYVGNLTDGTVSVIATANNSVVSTVAVGFTPQGLAVIPDGTKVYVANQVNQTISVIDTATNTVATTIGLNGGPLGVAAHPDGSKVYVSGDRMWVIDTQTDAVVDEIFASFGHGVAVHPDGSSVYSSSIGGFTVSVIDTGTHTVVDTVTVGLEPHGVDVHPDGSKVYVANFGTTTVSVIDTATSLVADTVTVGQNPRALGRFISPLKDVGGIATGYTPSHAACLNVTTQARVFIPIPSGEASWDCEAAGLVVKPGDKVRVFSQGFAQ